MKKLTSILCALVIALGAIAAPQLRAEKVASLSKAEKIEKKVAKQAFVGVKAIKEAKAEKVAFKHIRKAKAEATNVTIGSIGSSFYEEDNDVYYMLLDEAQETAYSFDIVCAEGSQDVELGKTYTLEDMIADYSTWGNPTYVNYGYGTAYTAATFKKTLDANDKVVIEATITDENGAEFNLRYDEALAPEAPQGGTFVADNVSNVYEDGEIQYALNVTDAKLVFYFDIVLAEGKDVVSGHEYTEADLNMQYSAVVFNNITAFSIATATFVKTVAEDGSYTIAAVIVDTEDNTWNITGSKAAPQISEKTLTLNGTIQGTYYFQIEAKNEDETEYVSLIIFDELAEGSLTEEDLYYPTVTLGTEGVDQVVYDIQEANLTVVYDSDAGAYIISGTMKGVNEDDDLDIVNFTVTLTIPADAPTAHNAKNVTFAMKDMTVSVTANYWELKGTDPNTEYFLNIRSLSADEIAGEYTEATLDDFYTYIGVGSSVFFDIKKAAITVTNVEGVIAITGAITFVDSSSKDTIYATLDVAGLYDGKTHPDYDANTTDFIVDFPNPTTNTSYVSEGLIYVMATNDDKTTILLVFNVATDATGLAAGEYEINLSGEAGTVSAGAGLDDEGYLSGSFAGNRNANNQVTSPIWWMVSGTVTIAESGLITVDAVNSYDKKIQCKLGKDTETAIENANAAAKAVKRIENGQIVIEKNGVRYNVLGAEMK